MFFKNNKRVSFRSVVIAAVLIVCGGICITAISLQFYFGKQFAEQSAQVLYRSVAKQAEAAINDLDERAKIIAQLISETQTEASVDPMGSEHPAFITFAESMREVEKIYSVYLGFANGDLIQLINLRSSKEVANILGAQPDDRWVMAYHTEISGERVLVHRFADDNLNVREELLVKGDFNSADRPWYQQASKTEDMVFTRPYLFKSTGEYGVTYGKKVGSSGVVVGVDVSLAGLAELLEKELQGTSSDAFIVTRDGELGFELRANVNSPDPVLSFDQLKPLLKRFGQEEGLALVEEDGKDFYVFISPLGNDYSVGRFFSVAVYAERLLAPFLAPVYTSLLLSFAVSTLLLLFAWWIAGRVARQMDRLAEQTLLVRERRYGEVSQIKSDIKEVHVLSQSLVHMSQAIQQYEQSQRELIDAIIKLIAEAIDAKSPYTAGHCERVPKLGLMIAKAAHASSVQPFDRFQFKSEEQWREFEVAAWLHDCGKISTPENVVDKGSKLEVIYNRIHEVRMRFEVLWRDAEISMLQQLLNSPQEDRKALESRLAEQQQQLQDDFKFIATCNVGGEFLDAEAIERLEVIAERTWERYFDNQLGLSPVEEMHLKNLGLDGGNSRLPVTEKLLQDKPEHIIPRGRPMEFDPNFGIDMDVPEHLFNQGELYNLRIQRGTLSKEDRFKINEHMINTIRMLERLPFTPDLANVPRYASTHHETMRGDGYPRKLGADDLSIPERILAVADIFEALTASDRPYKKGKTLSEALKIMCFMVKDQHIDKDVFALFLTQGVYQEYADNFMTATQNDAVNVDEFLSMIGVDSAA